MFVKSRSKNSKLTEFRLLTYFVRQARSDLRVAKAKITADAGKYNLASNHQEIWGCINRFDKVVIDAPETQQVDDDGLVMYCELFQKNNVCNNRKCPLFAGNLEYMTAQERYERFRNARRELVRGLFIRRK